MRRKLKQLHDQRLTFTATFERFGKKTGYMGREEKTVLLKDIRDKDGNLIDDHLWLNLTKQFQAADLKQGNMIQFDARCKRYKKGYRGWRWEAQIEKPPSVDYKLSHPTKVIVINRAPNEESKLIPNN